MTLEQFKSPNVYEREIDESAVTPAQPSGVPAGVIGTALKGPAFVPVTVGSFDEFKGVFGPLDPKSLAPYALQQYLQYRPSATYMRVLGCGANSTDAHITNAETTGRVNNAGFKLEGTAAVADGRRHTGVVQFIVGKHTVQANESYGMPMFTDNDSYSSSAVNVVRGIVFTTSGSRIMVLGGNVETTGSFAPTGVGPNDEATLSGGTFKLLISSTLGATFATTDRNAGVKVLTASLDPSSNNYIAKVLNTNPDRFVEEQHLLYTDFAVDNEIATATTVGVMSGTLITSPSSGEPTSNFRQLFGAYDTRYKNPRTPTFVSQPYGTTEYDLFYVEALDDGAYSNTLYKVSVSNVKASTDEADPHGSFTLEIRAFDDTDANPRVLERFNCSLDPNADNYVAAAVGDRKVFFNFDATLETERRVVSSGKYDNRSKYVRVVVTDAVEKKLVPADVLPFGFHGAELLKTNDSLTDTPPTTATSRIGCVIPNMSGTSLSGSILPPVPMRYKVTKGATSATAAFPGQAGMTELISNQLYWGVKFERNTVPLNANVNSEPNALVASYTKMMGLRQLDTLVTGSGADRFNNNKFTLARVAFPNTSVTHLTSSVNVHMKEAAYIRNGIVNGTDYTVNDGALGNRITFATVLAQDTASNFNRFSTYTKFTTFMYGGYDGLNFLDKNARRMNDRATSFDAGGGASTSYVAPGMLVNPSGTGQSNSNVYAYKTAIDVMTDPMSVNINILATPGIRESYITEYAATSTRDYGLAFYVMDIPSYDDDATRLYDDSTTRPDVDNTASQFEARTFDNNYVGVYYPNVYIDDKANKRRVKVPASVAALGALAFNDKVAYPWYAPAGFNRASLDFVSNVEIRLNVSDRDRLCDSSRINPIATFPKMGYVIYGQKTLQIAKSALDRVNVRRLLIEIKRVISELARKLVFENNTQELRTKFKKDIDLQLGVVQVQSGIEGFKVIMDETNNTSEDAALNKINGKIIVVPTRTFESVALDYVVSPSGVEFKS